MGVITRGGMRIVFPLEKRQTTPKMVYLEPLGGKYIRRSARVYASQTGQIQARFPLILPGHYLPSNSATTSKQVVSVQPDQTVIAVWDETERDEEEEPLLFHLVEREKEERQSPALQSSSHSDQHSEQRKHLIKSLKKSVSQLPGRCIYVS